MNIQNFLHNLLRTALSPTEVSYCSKRLIIDNRIYFQTSNYVPTMCTFMLTPLPHLYWFRYAFVENLEIKPSESSFFCLFKRRLGQVEARSLKFSQGFSLGWQELKYQNIHDQEFGSKVEGLGFELPYCNMVCRCSK